MVNGSEDFKVNPYKVEGVVDYDKFAQNAGLKIIDDDLKKRLEKYAGELHPMIRRDIFYAQRDMTWLLDKYEKGEKFYIYTGRAPTGPMSVGHLLPFEIAKWMQERFHCEVYIQIPDEEKFLAKDGYDIDKLHGIMMDNILDIIALGFKPNLTKIFLDTEYASVMYKNAVKIAKHITFSTIKDAFGFGMDSNIGKIFYTSMQSVPAMLKSAEENKNVPCLVPLAIDQDVHLRIARDVLPKLGYYKPSLIECKFLPGLGGESKMSSSEEVTSIYLGDNEEQVKKKIGKAFTGQQATAELQRKHGGDPTKCVVCQYYKYIFEPNDKKLEEIFAAERSGTLLAGEHKAHLADTINAFLHKHAQRKERAKEKIDKFILKD